MERRPDRPGLLVLPALLGGTIIGTLSNNILNVPLRDITRSFHAPISSGVLVISSFVLVLAAGMAFTGWIGDRFGRSRTLSASLVLMAAAQVGAALAPSLAVLVTMRAIQGLAGAVIPPAVMGMLAEIYPRERRARVMSAWAAANGAGQAIGPPLGGLLAGLWGWRSIFWLLAPLTVLVLLATRDLPRDGGRVSDLHWPGAVCLTLGATLLMTAATVVPQHGIPVWADVAFAGLGIALLAAFVAVSARSPNPLIRPELIVEPRFLRSAVASFTQQFALTCVLVVVPLYITGALERSTAVTGLVVFTLPAAMALLAPLVGYVADRIGPRVVLRAGLIVLALVSVGLGAFTENQGRNLTLLCALLVVVGVGVALVQTPAATGATRSPAGNSGTALGLFNMFRFGGAAFGAAWVAVLYPRGQLIGLFVGASLLLVAAMAMTLVGPDPVHPELTGSVLFEHSVDSQADVLGIESRHRK